MGAHLYKRREEYLEQKKRLEEDLKNQLSESEQRELEARRRGHSLESEIVFGNAFLPWLSLYKSPPTVKPATYGSYLDIYNVHFFEYFGEHMLFEITQDVVQEYYLLKQKTARAATENRAASPQRA